MFEYFAVDTAPERFKLPSGADFSSIIKLWQAKRKNRLMPGWRQFSLEDFVGWHARMALSEVLSSLDDVRFQFFGSDMVFQQGDDLTGCVLSERLPEAYDAVYREHIAEMMRAPQFAVGHVKAASDQDRHKTIAVAHLPLACDGETINRFLHVTCWKTPSANVLSTA